MPRKSATVPVGGALSLTGIEKLASSEKTARIAALVNDIYASIIFIAKHSKAGNLSKLNCKPMYDFVNNVMTVEDKQKRSLARELKRQDRRIERMAGQHQRDIQKLLGLARNGIAILQQRACRLQRELDELKGLRKVDLGDVDKKLSAKTSASASENMDRTKAGEQNDSIKNGEPPTSDNGA
ncbi:hypothetical protein LOZ58_004748 [Ophidiomyces ophidiicola]|nr:hypothetical protein LOZ66_001679 [Ophidiomyces ophidiicola]KAI1959040.1 hypothetical protein LOZ58_004748 [Ophidiomyces ophidiicola]